MDILFISNRCNTCATLIKLLQTDGMINNYKVFILENPVHRPQFPKEVQKVPTLISYKLKRMFVAQEIFDYLQSIRYIKHNNAMENSKRMMQQNIVKTLNNDLLGVVQTEVNGLSDTYAYKDDNINHAQPKSYFRYGDEKNNTIFTAPEQKKKDLSDTQKIQRVKEIDMKIRSVEQSRKVQEEAIRKQQSEMQINEVMKVHGKIPKK